MPTILKGSQIAVDEIPSTENNNLLRYNGNGIYFAIAAAPNLQNQYVSSSMGNDANDGTRAAPLKTIAKAVDRLPDGTSGNIWLYETDTFPVRTSRDPTNWGATVNYLPSPIATDGKSIEFGVYGPKYDQYNAAAPGSYLFLGWLLRDAPRPILEFGHYVYNGVPCGVGFTVGSKSGKAVSFNGFDIRITPEARAACSAAGVLWKTAGYAAMFISATGRFRGCKFPDPVVMGQQSTYIVSASSDVAFWQTSINSGTSSWLLVDGTSAVDFLDTAAIIYDGSGNPYPTQASTASTNVESRTDGLVRDSKGTTRNARCNLF